MTETRKAENSRVLDFNKFLLSGCAKHLFVWSLIAAIGHCFLLVKTPPSYKNLYMSASVAPKDEKIDVKM